MYESLGFEPAGEFGLLLGSRRAQRRPPERHRWAGRSGELYTYEVFDWPARLTPGPGNYVFATSTAAGDWHPLLVGECADLSTLAAQDRLRSAAGTAAGYACAHPAQFQPGRGAAAAKSTTWRSSGLPADQDAYTP